MKTEPENNLCNHDSFTQKMGGAICKKCRHFFPGKIISTYEREMLDPEFKKEFKRQNALVVLEAEIDEAIKKSIERYKTILDNLAKR